MMIITDALEWLWLARWILGTAQYWVGGKNFVMKARRYNENEMIKENLKKIENILQWTIT